MRICPSCGQPLPDGTAQCPRCNATTADLRTPFPPITGYEVVRSLGEGGMGAVYLATELKLNRRVAVKVVSRKLAAGTEAEARFLREARSMAQVEHPHIVRVYSFGEIEGQPYLVMEYVEGQDLAARLAREGSLPLEEALRITRQAAEALEAAWEHRVVHRDIKPSNILLDKRNQVRVADFGLAKPMRADASALLTQESYVLGTPHYASPEQVRGLALDFRSDIYSLGIVLYEMLTGERPFEGATPFDILNKQVMQPLPFLEEKRPDLAKGVARLVEWMTQKDPARRPASYRQLIESVETALEQGTVRFTPEAFTPVEADATIPLTPADYARAITPQPQPKRKWLLYAAPAAVLLAALAGWLVWKQLEKPAPSATPEKRLVVAVTPFYGPDEDSIKEGRMMAALVERAVGQRLAKYDVKVLGVEETKAPVRDHEAARALGEKLGATVVVWGEAFVLRGETEIQPYFTLVPPKQEAEKQEATVARRGPLGADPLAALQQRSAEAMKVGAAAPNQIEVRKTSAAGVGDMVMLLAGVHALYSENNPEKALEFFRETPETAESLRYEAEAYLQRKDKVMASAAIREAVRLNPRSAPAQAFLGDLLMGEGKSAEAGAAYRMAADAGGTYDAREAIWYLGKLYLAETTEIPGAGQKRAATGYLLGMDPKSGKVLERYRLPDNAVGFSSATDGFRVRFEVPAHPPGEIGFTLGGFDRPVFYSDNLLHRRNSVRAGENIALGFVGPLEQRHEIKPAIEKVNPAADAKIKTVEELEAALRRRMEKDLTQPWDLFWLGHALWAQGRHAEAEGTWAALFSIEFPGTPYFEYSQMAYYFERFSQPTWADRAFEQALARRKKMPQPVGNCYLIARILTASVVLLAARRSLTGQSLERDYLWLQRARELTGPSFEAEDLAAAAWERYFREKGQNDLADQEAAVGKRVRNHPGNYMAGAIRMDLSLYAIGSLGLGLLLLVALLTARAASRCERRLPPGWSLTVARWAVVVLVFAAGASLVGIAGFVVVEEGFSLAALIVAVFGLAVVLSVVFHRRLHLTASFLLVGTIAGFLGLFGLAFVFESKSIPAGLVTWGLGAVVALGYRFRHRFGLSRQGMPSRRDLVAAVSFHERLLLVAAVLAAQVAVGFSVYEARTVLAVASIPVGIMDAMGSDAFVADMEDRLKALDTPERRYVAAVSNHLAGRRERARELYESLPSDTRAQQNLSALNQDELAPAVALTSEDVLQALASRSWNDWLKDWFSPGSIADLLLLVGAPTPSGGPTRFLYWAIIALFAACVAHFVFIRPQPSLTAPAPVNPKRRWMYRFGFTLFPGLYDLRLGSVVRGYIVTVLACFLFLVGLVHTKLTGPLAAAPGIISGIAVPNIASMFPLPTPPGAAADALAAWDYHFWTLFWAYPYAKVFWPFVGLSVLLVLVYHATRLRRIWQI